MEQQPRALRCIARMDVCSRVLAPAADGAPVALSPTELLCAGTGAIWDRDSKGVKGIKELWWLWYCYGVRVVFRVPRPR